jgi:hypothetical protein
MAAEDTKDPSTKSWLRNDEEGTWEHRAKELLDKAPDIIAAKNLTMTDEQIDEEIASILKMSALEAMLAHAKKRKRKK